MQFNKLLGKRKRLTIFLKFKSSWKLLNPTYTHILWDDADNENLIRQHYPWFLEKYLSVPRAVSRADIARVFYMHKFGGVYSDLDSACYRPLDDLLSNHDLVLGSMWVPNDPNAFEYPHSIPNAWMASKPGHALWMHFADMILRADSGGEAEELAGPVMLRKVVKAYLESGARNVDSVHVAGHVATMKSPRLAKLVTVALLLCLTFLVLSSPNETVDALDPTTATHSNPILHSQPLSLIRSKLASIAKDARNRTKGGPQRSQLVAEIPKIIHQSWKTHDIPQEKFGNWTGTWKLQNPQYEYMLWDDSENENLIREHYPWFLPKYMSFGKVINKVDSARVFYMHKYGGVYADLDFACYRPLDSLLANHDLVLGSMAVNDETYEGDHSIQNAFMASKPGHSFWMHYANTILNVDSRVTHVEEISGPVALKQAVESYLKMEGVAGEESIFLADTGS
ncbi:hypothetical protein HDU98_007431 [Podochytrium sp. JEL0797]|nr:hypothetical protein HDU98_007431 [Podochytrium sp. JEL0797]